KELRQLLALRELRRHALGDAAGAADELVAVEDEERLQLLSQPRLGPARGREDARVLGRHDEQRRQRERQLRVVRGPELGGDAPHQRLRRARELVDDRRRAVAGEERDRRGPAGEAALLRERGPGRPALVLGEAERVLARPAERRAVDPARLAAADVL